MVLTQSDSVRNKIQEMEDETTQTRVKHAKIKKTREKKAACMQTSVHSHFFVLFHFFNQFSFLCERDDLAFARKIGHLQTW